MNLGLQINRKEKFYKNEEELEKIKEVLNDKSLKEKAIQLMK